MPLPFLVAAGIAAIGAGVGAIANETRREKEERERKNSIVNHVKESLNKGCYREVNIGFYDETIESDSRKTRKLC